MDGRPATGSAVESSPDEVEDAELDEPLPNAEGLITEAVALAGDNLDDAQLVRRYWRFAPDEELVGHAPGELLAAARRHRELASQRVPGELKLRIGSRGEAWTDRQARADQEVWADRGALQHTLIEIVTDDMPFLVDSVTAALADPQPRYPPAGPPDRGGPPGAAGPADRGLRGRGAGRRARRRPAWRAGSASRSRRSPRRGRAGSAAQRPAAGAHRRPGGGRGLAADARPGAGARRRAAPTRRRAAGAGEGHHRLGRAAALARRRPLHLPRLPGVPAGLRPGPGRRGSLQAVLGTGLGILRQDQPAPRVLSSTQPGGVPAGDGEAPADHHQGELPRHRAPVRLPGYIGFKVFDAYGNVAGERRFLGLFSSAAYRTSVSELPVVRRKVAEVLDRSGLSPRSHSGKDLMEILETYPRDELFQITTDDLYRTVIGVLRMAGRRQLRVFVRNDAYGRFISCLIYLPRDRFTTPEPAAHAGDPAARAERDRGGLHHPGHRVDARPGALHRAYRPGQPARRGRRGRARRAARRRHPAVGRRLPAGAGAQARRRAGQAARSTGTREALPEAYKDEHTPVRGGQGPGQAGAAGGARPAGDAPVPRAAGTGPATTPTCGSRCTGTASRWCSPPCCRCCTRSASRSPTSTRTRSAAPTATVYLYDFGLRLPDGARDLSRGTPARGERVLRDLARRGRSGRLQRAGRCAPG